jgi:serine/threonine protein kinase
MTRTAVGVVKGKIRYLAPELLDGRVADRRCDLFSLGVLSFELFFGDTALEAVRPSPYGPMFSWPDVLPRPLPPPIELMLRRLTSPDPERRHQSAGELLLELHALEELIAVDVPEGLTTRFHRSKPRPRLLSLASLVALAIALLVGTRSNPRVPVVVPTAPRPSVPPIAQSTVVPAAPLVRKKPILRTPKRHHHAKHARRRRYAARAT